MKERLRITAYCEIKDQRLTKIYDEWIHDGKTVMSARKVAEDYLYDYFDKHYYKIESVEKVDNMWDQE